MPNKAGLIFNEPKGSHTIRYYGVYSSRTRSIEKRPLIEKHSDRLALKARKKRWAQLIRLVFLVDPLACPRCGRSMEIKTFVLKKEDIERILTHLKMEQGEPPATGPPGWLRAQQAQAWINDHPAYFPEEDQAQEEPAEEAYFQDPVWQD